VPLCTGLGVPPVVLDSNVESRSALFYAVG
jgi:hypothetical protein